MAYQALHPGNLLFDLELHGVRTSDAKLAIANRLAECYRYGLCALRCSYGSPDTYEGSILAALLDIVLSSEYIHTEALSTWVFQKLPAEPSPVFLTIPIIRNPSPSSLNEDTAFAGFKAVHETDRGRRLICEMKFQPLRKVYNWGYASRAIKQGCSESLLIQMCQTLGIDTAKKGLTLKELMACATAWRKFPRSRVREYWPKQLGPQKETAETLRAEPGWSERIFVEWSGAPTVNALLLLIEHFVERGEYRLALKAADRALLLDPQEDLDQVSLAKGRVLMLLGDLSCETWLLKADEEIRLRSGVNSPRRIPVLRQLTRWYYQAHEYQRSMQYMTIGSELDPGSDRSFPLHAEFRARTFHANLLRKSGDYKTSNLAVVAAIKAALAESPDGPPGDLPDLVIELKNCSVPTVMIARALHISLMNYFDIGDVGQAIVHLEVLEELFSGKAIPDLWKADLEIARGNIAQARGMAPVALEHYSKCLAFVDVHSIDDRTRYELLGNMAVSLRSLGKLDRAAECYRRCVEIAGTLGYKDEPHYAVLLLNYCHLLVKQDCFEEVVIYGEQAYELLLLKKPSAYSDIGSSVVFIGYALNELQRFKETITKPSYCQSYLVNSGKSVDGTTLRAIGVLIKCAEDGARDN
jgi:tetratricopeptide (TPR) repeat protein